MKLKIIDTKTTHNYKDQDILHKIQSLWKDNHELVNKEMKSGKSIYILYHNYESDYTGFYDVSIAIECTTDFDFETQESSWLKYEVDRSVEIYVATKRNEIE